MIDNNNFKHNVTLQLLNNVVTTPNNYSMVLQCYVVLKIVIANSSCVTSADQKSESEV